MNIWPCIPVNRPNDNQIVIAEEHHLIIHLFLPVILSVEPRPKYFLTTSSLAIFLKCPNFLDSSCVAKHL